MAYTNIILDTRNVLIIDSGNCIMPYNRINLTFLFFNNKFLYSILKIKLPTNLSKD